MYNLRIVRSLFFCISAIFVISATSFATDRNWDSGGTNDNWSNSNNWEFNIAPLNNDDIYIRTNGADINVDYDITTSFTLNDIRLGSANYGPTNDTVFFDYNGDNLHVNRLYIADKGNAQFVQDYGTNISAQSIRLGSYFDTYAKYTLNGGIINADISIGTYISGPNTYSGYGDFVQNGGRVYGSIAISSGLDITQQKSTYELKNNGVISGNKVSVYNSAEFFQQSGIVNINSLRLSDGSYTLRSGTLTVLQNNYFDMNLIGSDSGHVGYFYQTGGSHEARGDLRIGYNGGEGHYEMDKGNLLVLRNEDLGCHSNSYYTGEEGYFVQKGGMHEVRGSLTLGLVPNSYGSYEMYNYDNTKLKVLGGLRVGSSGIGEFHQHSGDVDVLSGINIAKGSKYTIDYGTLDTSILNVRPEATFIQNGGKVNVTGRMSNGGEYIFEGDNIPGVGIVANDIANNGNFYQKGGTIDVDHINNTGSAVADARYYGDGMITGYFNNHDYLAIGLDDTAGFFTVGGYFRQINSDLYASSPELSIDLFGTTQGISYDYLNILGDAQLGGILSINLLAGFNPEIGDSFNIIRAAGGIWYDPYNRGLDYNLPTLSYGKWWEIVADTNNLYLKVGGDPNAVPEPASLILLLLGLTGFFVKRKNS